MTAKIGTQTVLRRERRNHLARTVTTPPRKTWGQLRLTDGEYEERKRGATLAGIPMAEFDRKALHEQTQREEEIARERESEKI